MIFNFISAASALVIAERGEHEAADSSEDDEGGKDAGPEVGLTRGGGDDVVLRDEALAREGIEDGAVGLQGAVAWIDDGARHGEGVGHVEPEDIEAVGEFFVQSLSTGRLIIEEHSISVRMEEIAESVVSIHYQDIILY